MQTIDIQGVEYSIPLLLHDITLGERIEYDRVYGNDLAAELKKIAEMKDNIFRESEFSTYQMSLACKTLSFFGKIPLGIVENTNIFQVLAIYDSLMKSYSEETNFADPERKIQNVFQWKDKDDIWALYAPELKQQSEITFGEIIDSKQVVLNLFEFGNGKWKSLLPLCCIYFRKIGEKYDAGFIIEGSERYELMKTLPLDYALEVAFFLSSSMTSLLLTSRFSKKAGPEVKTEMSGRI